MPSIGPRSPLPGLNKATSSSKLARTAVHESLHLQVTDGLLPSKDQRADVAGLQLIARSSEPPSAIALRLSLGTAFALLSSGDLAPIKIDRPKSYRTQVGQLVQLVAVLSLKNNGY